MADLKIVGKVIQVLQLASGMSKATGKEWKKQDYVIETFDNFPKKICFGLFNERIQQYNINVGDTITISFDVESREYQGRWYTDIRVWRVEQGDTVNGAAAPAAPAPASSTPFPPAQPASFASAPTSTPQDPFSSQQGSTDDLPF